MKVEINRQLLGLEDQLFGVGTVTQLRNGEAVVVTRINAANLPFDETMSLKEVIDSLTNLDLVAANIAAVDIVGSNINDVIRTSLSADNIDILVLDLTNVDIVAGSIASVNTTAGSITNVNIVGNDLSLAGYNGLVDAGLITDPVISSPSGFSSIETVAAGMDEVQLVAANMAEVLLADDNAAAAAASAIAAELSATNAAASYDSFDDRYLGSKTAEPTLDNDGNTLLVGAIYWNSVANAMYVWTGAIWDGMSSSFTATSTNGLLNKTIDDITNTVGADHVHYKVRNESGSIIPINTIVTASGTQPGTDYILVVPITDPQTQIAIGIVHTMLAVNGTGLVINTGVADDVDTSAWTVGTILYPSTAGNLTTTKPTSGRYQACSIVLRQHATQGTLLCEFTEPKYIASTTLAGYVQLNNTLTSTSTTEALTAAQGKLLKDSLTADAFVALLNADTTWNLDLGGLV